MRNETETGTKLVGQVRRRDARERIGAARTIEGVDWTERTRGDGDTGENRNSEVQRTSEEKRESFEKRETSSRASVLSLCTVQRKGKHRATPALTVVDLVLGDESLLVPEVFLWHWRWEESGGDRRGENRKIAKQ